MERLARVVLAAVLAAAAVAVYAAVAAGDSGPGHDGDRHGDHHGDRHHARHHKRHGDKLIRASLAPSLPTDPVFHGVAPGGAPWVLDRGEVRIKLDDRFELKVRGLVIPDPPGDDTPGPVETISASLFCGADADTVAADTTDQVEIDDDGDARIRDDDFDVPDTCLAPVVLVHPNGIAAAYIAVSGWRL